MEECKKCQGKLYYVVPHYQHDVLERIECMDCLSDMNYRDHLSFELSKLLIRASPQRLSRLLSEFIVNCGISLDEVESIIHTKNVDQAFLTGGLYSKK